MHVPVVCILNDIFNVIWRYSSSRQFASHDKSHFQSLFQPSDKWLCDKAVKSWPRFVLKLCGCCFSSIKEPTLDLTEDSPVLSLPLAESAGSLIQLLQKGEGIVCFCAEFSFFFFFLALPVHLNLDTLSTCSWSPGGFLRKSCSPADLHETSGTCWNTDWNQTLKCVFTNLFPSKLKKKFVLPAE